MENQNNLFKYAKTAVCFLIILAIATRHMGSRKAIAGIGDPVQTAASGGTSFELSGYHVDVEYLYSYEIEALVVSTHNYNDSSLGAKLAPVDAALAWGRVAEYNKTIDFHWRQSGRWYWWKVDSYELANAAGGVEEISAHSANNHLVPADSTVRKAVKKIRTGDHIRLSGYLVNINASRPDGATFWWNSSTTRTDTGDGSCEVIYVTGVQWIK